MHVSFSCDVRDMTSITSFAHSAPKFMLVGRIDTCAMRMKCIEGEVEVEPAQMRLKNAQQQLIRITHVEVDQLIDRAEAV
jgi:hypothetical protein